MNELQAIASDYARHGLTCIPALPSLKVTALDAWKSYQVDPPSEAERNAMFAESGLNVAVVCGSVSDNLIMVDPETPRAFDREYDRFYRAGLTNTWIDRSPSGGGHLWYKLPCAVRSRGVVNDVEIRAQNSYCLAPPSIAPSKVDGSLRPYHFQHKPPQILTIESLDQVHWLNLERVSLHLPFRAFPRKAQKLLQGEWDRNRYESRSEVEHAIVVMMVNQGFSFEEILSAFRRYPTAGKFQQLQGKDPHAADSYLRGSWNNARDWCIRESAARRNALELVRYAQTIPWRGRLGSSQRAVFIAHCGLAYRSGQPTYHASVRDIAEIAACDKTTASTATASLCAAGTLKLIQHSAFTFARRFELPNFRDLEKTTKLRTLPIPTCEGVSEVSSFLIPEAFRMRGLGRSAFEVLQALDAGPLTAQQIAENSGRNVQTVRTALKRLKVHGLAVKAGRFWRGRALSAIDLDGCRGRFV